MTKKTSSKTTQNTQTEAKKTVQPAKPKIQPNKPPVQLPISKLPQHRPPSFKPMLSRKSIGR